MTAQWGVSNMAAGITFGTNVITSPVWCADFLSRDHLIPGPIEVDPTAFPLVGTKRQIKDGTLIGRTFAERDAATPFGLAAATDDEFFLVAFSNSDAVADPTVAAVRPHTVIKENFLPDWAAIAADAALLAKLRAVYQTQKGAA
jgi:hypothetical protein